MNQTPNYKLSQWEADDRVQRTDFNADNAKIDAAIKAEADARTAGDAALQTAVAGKASASALNALTSRVTTLERERVRFGCYVGNATANRAVQLPWAPTLILIAGILDTATALFLISQDGSISFIGAAAYNPPHAFSPFLKGSTLMIPNKDWCNKKDMEFHYIIFR